MENLRSHMCCWCYTGLGFVWYCSPNAGVLIIVEHHWSISTEDLKYIVHKRIRLLNLSNKSLAFAPINNFYFNLDLGPINK